MDLIIIFKAIILGIIEGITEWLPISSTGHMILVDEFLKLGMSPEFMEMFFVVIQLGAIMAVVVLYWKKIFPFNFNRKPIVQKNIIIMWIKIVIACIPAAIVGLLWDDQINALFYNFQTVAIMLIVFGILFIVVENYNKGRRPIVLNMVENADLLIAADCTAFSYGNFHNDFMRNRITLIGCPKLDNVNYAEKLADIFRHNNIRSITVTRMTVPCCGGLPFAVKNALAMAEKNIPQNIVTIKPDGSVLR